MIIIGIIIKLSSPGPILYLRNRYGHRVYRIGKNAKPFLYFKFRSMFIDAETVTKFGCFIRRWHLDELPELFLVFIGSMSLVGPRPWSRDTVMKYKNDYYKTLQVRPGITGLFQIYRFKNNTVLEAIRLNNIYVEKCGFLMDLVIVLKTPLIILRKKGGVKSTFLIL